MHTDRVSMMVWELYMAEGREGINRECFVSRRHQIHIPTVDDSHVQFCITLLQEHALESIERTCEALCNECPILQHTDQKAIGAMHFYTSSKPDLTMVHRIQEA